ncbi:hypothetical protein ACFWBC_26695, partial [Streptomyces sp. NPDC059985]|uniref:hypothetical protein n=1 Tax=Streptomyces sp. NPDC059985 TaxID=3347025 RepID=UPI003673E70D
MKRQSGISCTRLACITSPLAFDWATTPLLARVSSAGVAGGTVLTAFARAFKTPDLRKKLLFTL